MERDKAEFSRQRLTAPLQPNVTGPLPSQPDAGNGPAELASWDVALHGHLETLIGELEERMQLLARVSLQCGLLPRPLWELVPRAPASLKEQRLASHLEASLAGSEPLVQAVVLALDRFLEASRLIGWRLEARPPMQDLPRLRRLAYFLSNVARSFKDDRVMALIFPVQGPDLVVDQARRLAKLPPSLAREREALRRDALALEKRLIPAMTTVGEVLELHESPLRDQLAETLGLGRLKVTRLLLGTLGREGLVQRLHAAYTTFCELQQCLRGRLDTPEEIRALRLRLVPLGRLPRSFSDYPPFAALFA